MLKVVSISENKLIVSQSNKMIEARYSLGVGEQRLILSMMSLIQPNDTELQDYVIKVKDLANIWGCNSNTIYDELDKITTRLLTRILEIKGEDGSYLKFNWISSAEYKAGSGVLHLEISKKLRPYLLQLKEKYKSFGLYILINFRSMYSLRIYMLLKQYEDIGHREFNLVELREILGIEPNQYAQYKEFNRWVLNQAKKEFEKKSSKNGIFLSDISFDLETIRTGRKITRLKFIIKKQVYPESLKFKFPNGAKLKDEPEMITRLKHYGISEKVSNYFLDKNGEDSINGTLELYEERLKQKKVTDKKGGYLIKLLEDQAGAESPHEKEEKEVKKVRQQAQIKAEKIAQAKNKAEAEAEKKEREALDRKFEILSEERQAEIEDNFKQSLLPIEIKMVEKHGVKSKMFMSKYYQFLSELI